MELNIDKPHFIAMYYYSTTSSTIHFSSLVDYSSSTMRLFFFNHKCVILFWWYKLFYLPKSFQSIKDYLPREREVVAFGGDHPLTAVGLPPHHQVHANLVGSDRLLSLSLSLSLFHSFLVVINFVATICFMRTRLFLCFDYLCLFRDIWETKTRERERNRGWEERETML